MHGNPNVISMTLRFSGDLPVRGRRVENWSIVTPIQWPVSRSKSEIRVKDGEQLKRLNAALPLAHMTPYWPTRPPFQIT